MKDKILAILRAGPQTADELRRRLARTATIDGWRPDAEAEERLQAAIDELMAEEAIYLSDQPIRGELGLLTGEFYRLVEAAPPEPEQSATQRFIQVAGELLHIKRFSQQQPADFRRTVQERQDDLDALPIPDRETAVNEFVAEIAQLKAEFAGLQPIELYRAELAAAETLATARIRRDYSLAHRILDLDTQQTARQLEQAQAAYNQALYRRQSAGYRRDAILRQLTDDYGTSDPGRAEAEARAERVFGERWEIDQAKTALARLGLKRWPRLANGHNS